MQETKMTVEEFLEKFNACENNAEKEALSLEASMNFSDEELTFISTQLGLDTNDSNKEEDQTGATKKEAVDTATATCEVDKETT